MHSRLTETERAMRDSVEHMLESYHYVNRASLLRRMVDDNARIFLDSGAFSAFTQGVSIDLPTYCSFIRENSGIIECASVLDSIGDFRGTAQNQAAMERLGTSPLPCYHYGEPTEVLDWYISNYSYITIGGMVPISTPQLKVWLDRIWAEHLTHPDGRPKIKVHGFGLTSLPLMMRYPWYSVDSSTWVQWAAHGMILVPGVGQVNISARSEARKTLGQHIDSITPIEREAVEAAILARGVDPDRMRHVHDTRWAWNCWAFPYYARSKVFENDRFVPETMSLF